ncbi:hypothetical protein SLE2022_226210 [Rubroshorea leprosula]
MMPPPSAVTPVSSPPPIISTPSMAPTSPMAPTPSTSPFCPSRCMDAPMVPASISPPAPAIPSTVTFSPDSGAFVHESSMTLVTLLGGVAVLFV